MSGLMGAGFFEDRDGARYRRQHARSCVGGTPQDAEHLSSGAYFRGGRCGWGGGLQVADRSRGAGSKCVGALPPTRRHTTSAMISTTPEAVPDTVSASVQSNVVGLPVSVWASHKIAYPACTRPVVISAVRTAKAAGSALVT